MTHITESPNPGRPAVYRENEDFTVEWWCGRSRCLSISAEPDGNVTFLKVWGPNISTEMQSGNVDMTGYGDGDDPTFVELWEWLVDV